ncbi:hypothetical protein JMUB7529_28050 [Staphylococcus aureus]
MAKLGENTPHIIDATVDFMASSQAFREYLKKLPPDNTCLLYTSPSPRDMRRSRMPSSA